MKLNRRGQVTIPAVLRHRYGLIEGDEVEVVADGDSLRIIRRERAEGRGAQIVRQMRNRATTTGRTGEFLDLTRGD